MPSLLTTQRVSKRVYLATGGDTFIGRSLGPAFQAVGYEVLTSYHGDESPSFASASFRVGSEDCSAIERQFMRLADVIVVELMGHEQTARHVAIELARQPFGGRQQTLIAVSDPLVWAMTAPRPTPSSWGGDGLTATLTKQPPGEEDAVAATGGDGDSASASGGFGPSTVSVSAELDMARRSPCLAAVDILDVETTVLRAGRRGRLSTHVVCPGLLYGNGECDRTFQTLFRQSWEMEDAPCVYGSGANYLPMVHISDLASYIVELAAAAKVSAVPQYMLVADEGQVTQAALVEAISKALGKGEVRYIPKEQLLHLPGTERLTLDLAFTVTPLPSPALYRPGYESLPHRLADVVDQYRERRNIRPLRIVLTGPPMAGKSALAARLSRSYGLRHIRAKDLLDPTLLASVDPELQKAVAAEMSGKEPRVSGKNMARLLQTLISSEGIRNRGYILDAFPKASSAARFAFMKAEPLTPEEVAQKEKAAAPPPKGGKDAKGKAAPGGADGPDVPDGYKLIPDLAFAPTHVIEVNAEEADLKLRLKAVEASEAAAAVAAANASSAASAPPAKGGGKDAKGGAVAPGGHNNDAGFARRLDVYQRSKAEAAEDLQARIQVAQKLWEFEQAKAKEARDKAEAEANTLKAKRRKAKLEALNSTTATNSDALQTTTNNPLSSSLLPEDLSTTPVAGPVLPEYGGLSGLLVHDCGAAILELSNPNLETGVVVATVVASGTPSDPLPAGPSPPSVPVTLPEAEAALKSFLGPPHNFEGFVKDEEIIAAPLSSETEDERLAREAAERTTRLEEEILALSAESLAQATTARLTGAGFRSAALTQWLLDNMMPVITEGLVEVAKERPNDPVGTLAALLSREADRLEGLYIDPYTDPTYGIQIAKIEAKAERDAERAAKLAEKEERELALKLAMKAEADKMLVVEEAMGISES